MNYIVISSRRFENDVLAYGPFIELEKAKRFMLDLAKRVDDCPLNELEDNYHIDTDCFFFDIATISDPKTIEE